MSLLTYIPPDGDAVEFGKTGVYRLLTGLDGLLTNAANGEKAQAVAQVGSTIVATRVAERTVTSQIAIWGRSREEVWQAREDLAGALWVEPSPPDVEPEKGTLRFDRPVLGPVEVEALPVNSPRGENWQSPLLCLVDVEWLIGDPRWREGGEQNVSLEEGGGFYGPISGPLYALSANIEAEVINTGTAASPIVARIYGEVITPRLINMTTDETIEITGTVADGDYLRIDTGFRRKRVTLHRADGTTEDVMNRLNLDLADFWRLAKGVNTIRFEADDNISGRVWLTWIRRLGGV